MNGPGAETSEFRWLQQEGAESHVSKANNHF